MPSHLLNIMTTHYHRIKSAMTTVLSHSHYV